MRRAVLAGSTGLLLAAVALVGGRVPIVANVQVVRPRPVRNDIAQAKTELLVLRNHRLQAGGHQRFYELSRDAVWPYYERIGARMVGQWKRLEPQSQSPGEEDVYRLARYAGYEHWLASRPGNDSLGGNGPGAEAGTQGMSSRRGLELGSKGAYFMTGKTAQVEPRFMPGLPGEYEVTATQQRPTVSDADIPVRFDVAQPDGEIVELRYQRIRKGAFDRFVALTAAQIWPWEEKLGARPIGQWRLVYPAPSDGRPGGQVYLSRESAEYDQIITMTRFAGARHREALMPDHAVLEGGNGPDYQTWQSALAEQRSLTLSTSVELLEGSLYQSPPVYMPSLPEVYRRVK